MHKYKEFIGMVRYFIKLFHSKKTEKASIVNGSYFVQMLREARKNSIVGDRIKDDHIVYEKRR